ncbi:MAG: 16S rRNA (adenine(1518)-N(6)/adenine(1519)-N(6))-dimethyltransferase RsmA [Proteobacteria bacterium]|nr:16S rRNA (adenine(1518)-N(6)/adenine(1519)-N(6))-dimethyltransferase RsmA [Pseudomonadota bacterium]NOG59856.1 16S rRNA (adenine(1518)-N(6)/adenine(1519)-N(6))-dimethyltransferase RsmA [Pseudomonadota bacterium]
MSNSVHHQARKRFGQNFLHDPAIIQRIVDNINPQRQDRIIEIGPGKGALTELILERVESLDVVEIDRDLVESLTNSIGKDKSLKIHETDALKLDLSKFAQSDLRIVGNLPYNISTPLLFHLLNYRTCIKDMLFMLQKEVVDRICANPGCKQYGRLSIMLQIYCDVESLFIIKPGAFNPSPKVDSAIVKITPLAKPRYELSDHESLKVIVREAFTQRRKTIRNSLKKYISESDIKEFGIAPEIRAEKLEISDFVRLANCYHQLKINSL